MFTHIEIFFLFFVIYACTVRFDFIKDRFRSFKERFLKNQSKKNPVISPEMLQEAIENRTYGNFILSPAIIFFKDGDVIPTEGYKTDKIIAPDGRSQYRLIVSASSEKILDLFDDFVKLLGETCSMFVEDFRTNPGDHIDHFAYHKDTFAVRSILLDFEEFILNDGFVGLAIWNEFARVEVQLTVHKIIIAYASEICSFKQVLAKYGIPENPELKFLFEDFHLLIGTEAGDLAIEALKDRLCVDCSIVQAGDPNQMMN